MALFNILSTADSSVQEESVSIINQIKNIDEDNISHILSYLSEIAMQFCMDLLIAIVVFYAGRWILKHVVNLVDISFEKRQVDTTVRSFVRSLVKVACYAVIIIAIVQILGVDTTSLVALLASAGLAVGMALSGTLQNFAGGVMILFLRPYRVGDYITTMSESGTVKEIMLFTTVLETPDRHTIFVPNSSISSSIIDNASFADTRRVDWSVGISYGDSVATAREAILAILKEDKRIFTEGDKAPMVGVSALADSSVNLTVRGWVKTADYWGVYFDTYEKFYERLPKSGVNFPFPQMDIHIDNKNA